MMIIIEPLFSLIGVIAGCCWFFRKLGRTLPLALAVLQIKLLFTKTQCFVTSYSQEKVGCSGQGGGGVRVVSALD